LLVGATTSAFGVPANQTLRVVTPQTFRGICCFSWFESVSVSEPATPVPVAITWSVDYTDSVGEFVGLSVNGGACQFYGSSSLYASETNRGAMTRTFNWIVFPTDGPASIALHKGTNTFTLCGGGMFFAEQSVTLLNNTLSARTAQ
jgi:hypothetical protein